ncbi:fascin domain-containing protein [Nonomuraea sp. CA-141351]|uniref:fascin domain-containing protein n=1 Tax=Nonomuraea sp. CA-141351 TaxID=3239996 RepID=UPI003D8F2229
MPKRSFIAFPVAAVVAATGLVSMSPSQANADTCLNTTIISDVNNMFVSAELNQTGTLYGMLRARATSVGPWERFRICESDGLAGSTTWTIQSLANGKYVSAELNYEGHYSGLLRARADSPGPWEKFRFSGDPFTLRQSSMVSLGNGRYVTTEVNETGSSYAMLRARASSVGAWERYRTCSTC